MAHDILIKTYLKALNECFCFHTKRSFAGGLEALHQTIGLIHDNKRKLAVLQAMRNLSDVATNLDTLAGLVIDLIFLGKLHFVDNMHNLLSFISLFS